MATTTSAQPSEMTDDWKAKLKRPPRDTRVQTEDVTRTKGQDCLKRELVMGILEKGFEEPSPVQEESIPVALDTDKDSIQAMALVRTRELALQTSQISKELSKHLGMQVMVTTGGASLRDDIMRLDHVVYVVVATPSRVLDLTERGVANMTHCGILVTDEADKLLSMNQSHTIDKIISYLPSSRQILCYSVTFPVSVQHFTERYLQRPSEINFMDELTLSKASPNSTPSLRKGRKFTVLINTLVAKLQINQT